MEKVLDEKRNVSSRISEICRYIGFGLVALCFSLLTSDNGNLKTIVEDNENSILFIGFTGCATIIADYLQFLFGFFSVNRAIADKPQHLYDDTSIAYKGRNFFFAFKQITALMGSIFLVFIIFMKFYR